MEITGRVIFHRDRLLGHLPADIIERLAKLDDYRRIDVGGYVVFGNVINGGPYDSDQHELFILVKDFSEPLPLWLEGVPCLVEVDKIVLDRSLNFDLWVRSSSLHWSAKPETEISLAATDYSRVRQLQLALEAIIGA